MSILARDESHRTMAFINATNHAMVDQPKNRKKMAQLVGHVAVACGHVGWHF